MTEPDYIIFTSFLGWIPFTVCTVLSGLFSTAYILWFRSVRERDKCKTTTAISIMSLVITLMTAALVPGDFRYLESQLIWKTL